MSTTTSSNGAEDAVNSLVAQLQSTYSSVSTKAVLSQLGIMAALSVSDQLWSYYYRLLLEGERGDEEL